MFIHGRIALKNDVASFTPVKSVSRLQMQSSTDGIIFIPKSIESIEHGEYV